MDAASHGFEVDPDIRKARTPPAWIYTDPGWYRRCLDELFSTAWHHVGDVAEVDEPGRVAPEVMLPGSLDLPVVLARDAEGRLRVLSNVCTHRAALVVQEPGLRRSLRCPYHGRRFGLDGRMLQAPGFEDAEGFPTAEDDLPELAAAEVGPLVFASLQPSVSLEAWLGPLLRPGPPVALADLRRDPGRDRSFEIEANWLLYVENYLEGFHIPYVHRELHGVLEASAYETRLFPWGVLQLGAVKDPADAFPDAGEAGDPTLGAWYLWLFPNLMLNLYPWGLSLNRVEPLGVSRTRIVYRTYLLPDKDSPSGAGAELDQVEHEDDAVVESVQRGVRSLCYRRGRYAPRHERGVHHCHRLLARGFGGAAFSRGEGPAATPSPRR